MGNRVSEASLGQYQDPQAALRALQGARALQGEVTLLRGRNPASKEEIVRLLSKVILFRLALADTDIDITENDKNRGKP